MFARQRKASALWCRRGGAGLSLSGSFSLSLSPSRSLSLSLSLSLSRCLSISIILSLALSFSLWRIKLSGFHRPALDAQLATHRLLMVTRKVTWTIQDSQGQILANIRQSRPDYGLACDLPRDLPPGVFSSASARCSVVNRYPPPVFGYRISDYPVFGPDTGYRIPDIFERGGGSFSGGGKKLKNLVSRRLFW